MKTTLILNREKTFWEIFATSNFFYCTFGCTRKSQNRKWHRIQRAPWSSYHRMFTRILGDPGQGKSGPENQKGNESFQERVKEPLGTILTRPFANGLANAGSWLGTKNPLYYWAQSANSESRVTSVCSYTRHCCFAILSGLFTKVLRELRFWLS